MATKEELKSRLGQVLEQRRAERTEAIAPVQEKIDQITQLIKEGDTRQAYRIFEELPILDQLALQLTPVVGDALAVFETGEFGTRAGERFEQDDTLGGLGNLALSGLSAASTIPVIGALPTVAKTLTRVGRVADDIPGGSVSGPTELPRNEYPGTRPEQDGVTYQGLASPHVDTLRSLDPQKKYKLQDLVEEIIRKTPGKTGELRGLKVIEDMKPTETGRGQTPVLTTEVQKFFPNLDEVTPAGLELFMRPKLTTALEVRRSPEVINNRAGLRTEDSEEFLYFVDDVNMRNYYGDHTGEMRRTGALDAPDSTVAFSSIKTRNNNALQGLTDDEIAKLDNTKMKEMRADRKETILNAAQSDYAEFLGRQQRRRKELGFKNTNPFVKPEVTIPDNVKELSDDLTELATQQNKIADEFNQADDLDFLFEADTGLPKSRVNPPKMRSYDVLAKEGNKISRQIDSVLEKIKSGLAQSNPELHAEGYFKSFDLDKFLDIASLPPAKRKVFDRNLHYGVPTKDSGIQASVPLDSEYYGGFPAESFKLFKKIDVDSIDDKIKQLNLEDSDLVFKKDMYQKGNQSDFWKFVIRDKVNRVAQTTDSDVLTIPLNQIRLSGEIGGERGAPSIRNIVRGYIEQGKELKKIAKELGLPEGSVREVKTGVEEPFRVKNPDYDPDAYNILEDYADGPLRKENMPSFLQPVELNRFEIDLDPVREALAEGKKIYNMKEGGPVGLQSIIDNL